MLKRSILFFLIMLISKISFEQSIDSLKLNNVEIPAGYSKIEKITCATAHACSVYDQAEMLESLLGKTVKKDFQSFSSKNDKGAILYFQFDKEFTGQTFLENLLWGDAQKASTSEPDEYYAKGNILVIWSFNLKSQVKESSKAKVQRLLDQ